MVTYRLLQSTCCLTLLARGWLTFRFDHPVRGLLWDESFISPIIQSLLGMDWADYHASSDNWITPLIKGLGLFWMVSSLLPWFLNPEGTRQKKSVASLLVLAGVLLAFDAYCRFNENTHLGMLLEYALQSASPMLVCIWSLWPDRRSLWRRIAMAAAAATFVGHGLFALGVFPVPGHFVSMTIDLLGCSEPFARQFLWCAGALDLIVAALIWIPRTRLVGFGYMVAWGTATTVARPLTLIDPAQSDFGIALASGETLVRTGHWCIPLILLMLHWMSTQATKEPSADEASSNA